MLLSNTVLDRILDAASGADFAEVFCEESRQNIIRSRSGHIDNSAFSREAGVGIRVFFGLHSRYAYTNDLREETLLRLARELSEGHSAARRTPLGKLTSYGDASRQTPSGGDYLRKLEIINRAVSAGMEASSEITQMAVRYLDADRQILVANTDGLLVSDSQQKTRIQISAYAQSGGEIQSGFAGPGAMAGLEFYDRLDVEGCARDAARQAVTAVHSRRCPGGMMSVVVDSGFGGLLFHEACGHSLEANSVAKGTSEFSGKLGQQVASPLVTLIDDGTLPGEWGSISIDDEGNPSQRNVLIENGILKGYLVDRLESRRMGMPATGSGRRQNYRYAPEARMTNTFLAPGGSTREEIIAATERGLFVGSINGGSVNPVTGEFNFSALDCWLIENGRLTEPVHGATLIGSGGEVLRQVDMVGNNPALGQGYCYNNSGALFIGAGQPSIRVKNILVGGLA